MTSTATRMMNIADLANGIDAINPVIGAYLAQACAVSLDRHGHVNGVSLTVKGDFSETFELRWNISTEIERRGWDKKDPTDSGACCIAVLLIRDLTNYSVIERACIGTGIDYWLGHKNELPFQNKARLEVSGIGQGMASLIESRVKKKKGQTKRTDWTKLPAYIVVVEFSKPESQMVKK